MDRLSPEDIKRARFELAELERRFLTRVAQSHRSAKATGKGAKDNKDKDNKDKICHPKKKLKKLLIL